MQILGSRYIFNLHSDSLFACCSYMFYSQSDRYASNFMRNCKTNPRIGGENRKDLTLAAHSLDPPQTPDSVRVANEGL